MYVWTYVCVCCVYVCVQEPLKAEFRLYEHLFDCKEPGKKWMDHINPNSLAIYHVCVCMCVCVCVYVCMC